MPANENTTTSADIQVTARAIDFVTSFARNWDALKDVLGISRPIKKQAGAVLKYKYAQGSLNASSKTVGEGEAIPRSKYTVKEKAFDEMIIEKYSKETTIEAVNAHGYDVAIGMTDEEFKVDLQDEIMSRFYKFLATGTLEVTGTANLQKAISKSIGKVKNKFKQLHRNITKIAVFVNIDDFYDYLGDTPITTQTAFGQTYIENFLGADIIFLCSDTEVPPTKVFATPVNNMVSYYVDPASSDFAKAGLEYIVDGETNLVGFKAVADYDKATSVSYAIMGFKLFAEYLDGIAVATIGAA